MGDTSFRPTDDSSYKSQSDTRDSSLSQAGANEDGELKVDPREISSQQSNLQAGCVQGQYGQHQQPPQTRPESFNLGSLNTALPELSYQSYGHLPQRYAPAPVPSGSVYQMHNNPQYTGFHVPNPTNVPYPYPAQYQGVYLASSSGPQAAIGKQPYHQGFMQQQQPFGSPYYMQPSQYGHQSQTYPGIAQYGVRSNRPGEGRIPLQQRANEYLGAGPSGAGPGRSSSSTGKPTAHGQPQVITHWDW